MKNEDSSEKQKVISPHRGVEETDVKQYQELETSTTKHSSPALENEEVYQYDIQKEDKEIVTSSENDASLAPKNEEVDLLDDQKEDTETKTYSEKEISQNLETEQLDAPEVEKVDHGDETYDKKDISSDSEAEEIDAPDFQKEDQQIVTSSSPAFINMDVDTHDLQNDNQETETSNNNHISPAPDHEIDHAPSNEKEDHHKESSGTINLVEGAATSNNNHISPAPDHEIDHAPYNEKEDHHIESSGTINLVEGAAVGNVNDYSEMESSNKCKDSPTELSCPETSVDEHSTETDFHQEGQEKGNSTPVINDTRQWDKIDSGNDDREEEAISQKIILNGQSAEEMEVEELDARVEDQVKASVETKPLNIENVDEKANNENTLSENPTKVTKNLADFLYEDDQDASQGSAWPEKAASITNLVKAKSVFAVSSLLRRLSGRTDVPQDVTDGEKKDTSEATTSIESGQSFWTQMSSRKVVEKSGWNLLTLVRAAQNAEEENRIELKEEPNDSVQPLAIKGRILLYTRLGCQDCKEARQFLHRKGLNYIEVNIDVYPGRKLQLEKNAGSSAVPIVFFNKVLIGGLDVLKVLDESGKLEEKIEYVINESPSFDAPLPPLSGEDDESSNGAVDELAIVARKMKETIVIRDRFCKLRRVVNCFQGSEAVDFLSEYHYLEREEAIEFGRKLAGNLLLQHVFEENIFEDGNHLYRFLDHDPVISQCQNIPRGIIELKPKPIIELSSRMRFLVYAILEAYASEDGKHLDYRSIHGSEEFARYLRILEELHRVDLEDMPREEKLAFFINLYNMMAIHAILMWGSPAGVLDRRKLVGDFKYVIGGYPYTLSAIHNGILRGNQRAPYTFSKPFGGKDKRIKVALPSPEPLTHFALVGGNRSAPALRCYSPGNIDTELIEAAHNFLSSGGLVLDINAKTVSISQILKWYSIDFGKNEAEVLKYAANYLELSQSDALLELLASTQLKVVYQPYDWGLNS